MAASVQDSSFRRAIEALGPRQARTASVLRLLDVIPRMLHGDDESRREAAHGAGQGFASGGVGCPE
jgi:hypothetical protein